MKKSLLLSLGLILTLTVFAQEKDTTYWKKGGFVGLTFSNVTLSNWASGGNESVALNGVTSIFADYKKSRTTWENSLDIGYGLIKQSPDLSEDNVPFRKSDDKINFVTKWGYRIKNENNQWYFSALIDFRTQFDEGLNGEDQLISDIMSPGYLTTGLGIDYKYSEKMSVNYIPLTGKMTFVMNDSLAAAGAFGVDPGENFRAELGSFFRIKYKNEILKNVNLDTRIELFTNYMKKFSVDVNWQNTVVMKINSFLSANWYSQLIYDKDIKISNEDGTTGDAKVQLKSVFGVGLTYKFGEERKKK